MARDSGSAATTISQAQRRSNRANRGCNGRDVQLGQLGERLTAPTRVAKKRFAPDEGIQLEVNARAPAPKKRRTRKAHTNQPLPTNQPPRQQPSAAAEAHTDQSLPANHPSPPHRQPSAAVEDHRYSFSLAQPIQRPVAPVSRQGCTRSSSPFQLTSLILQPLPLSIAVDDHDISEFESDVEPSALQPEIDEQSDDEDDRQAHLLLRAAQTAPMETPIRQLPAGPQIDPVLLAASASSTATPLRQSPVVLQSIDPSFVEYSEDDSVLRRHHIRNRAPKAPMFIQPDPNPCLSQKQRRSCTGKKAPSRTLESYPPSWQEVITYAKHAFRAYVAGQCGFPDPVSSVHEARECLEDALEVHKEDRGTVEPGYVINKDMATLVFGESSQLRSQLKTDIRVQVRNLKALFPDSMSNGTSNNEVNFEAQRAATRAAISEWTADGAYLHVPVPGSDAQIHFGHPIIESTCKSFYFDKWSKISTFDPDLFHGSVPKPLVALVGTIFRNVLDEWASGTHNTVKLETDQYSLIYDTILELIETVDKDPHHGEPLRKRLSSWAGYGR